MAGEPCPTPRVIMQYGSERVVPCGRRSCVSCGVLWLGDTRIRVLAAAFALRGSVALVTVTAPGVEWLPWDEAGEHVEERAAAEWNAAAPAEWSELHQAAAARARRVARDHGTTWCLLVKVWEYQRRGVLHLHLLVPVGSAGAMAASTAYVSALSELADAYGFGYVDRGKLTCGGGRRSTRTLSPVAPERAAGYVAGYVASTGAGKPGIAEVARRQGVPGAVVYVSRRLTDRSGVTMRSLRDRRRVLSRSPGFDTSWEAWRSACLVDAVSRRLPPLTAGTRGALLAAALAEGWTEAQIEGSGWVTQPTTAAPPSQLTGDECKIPRLAVVAVIRLDLVLHHDDASGRPAWKTEGRCVGRWTFPREQEAHRERIRRCVAGPRPGVVAVPSGA